MKNKGIKSEWLKLFNHDTKERALIILNKCITKYEDNNRNYHNLNHINYLFKLINSFELTLVENRILLHSALFHDVIYSPYSKTNEELSAEFAESSLKALKGSEAIISKVKEIILATKNHQSSDRLSQLFLDMDRAILGSTPHSYAIYCNQIKQEYSKIPSFIYRRNRKLFLNQTLSQNRIFYTSHFFTKYENQARENMLNELNQLL